MRYLQEWSMLATRTFISIGRRVTQEWKFAFCLCSDSILLFKGQKRNIRNPWFSILRIISGRQSLIQLFRLLDASVPESLWQRRSQRLQQGSIVTPFPAVEHRHRSPFSEVFPCSIYLSRTSNNGSIGFTPHTTSKMISLSKDILFVVDLGHLESFVGITLGTKIGSCKKSNKSASESICNVREVLVKDINTPPLPTWSSYGSMCNVYMFRNVREMLVKDVNTHTPTPRMIIQQHVQHVKPFQGIVNCINGTSQN